MAKVSKLGKPEQLEQPEQLIYCGPNIPGGMLQRYAVFKGGVPVHLGGLFDKCPAIKLLFVPVANLSRVERAIETKGTPENAYFNEILQFISKGGV